MALPRCSIEAHSRVLIFKVSTEAKGMRLWLRGRGDIYQADLLGLHGPYQSIIIRPHAAATPRHQILPPPMMFRLLNHIINQPLGASQVLCAR